MQMLIIVILTELYYIFMYVISMTSSFVNTCVTHMSFIVFVNVVYSMSSAKAHAWSRILFVLFQDLLTCPPVLIAQMPFCVTVNFH